jgi:tRNA A37 threonylcarbamoyladenosine dehydratase
LRTVQAFGERTYQNLSEMTVGVVGCSGTGSPVIEQLTRLGIRKLVLVDPDIVEKKNLNRIINTTISDAKKQKPKVIAIADAIKKSGWELMLIFIK